MSLAFSTFFEDKTKTTPTLTHFVNHRPLRGPYPEGLERAYCAMGCFWGAERLFWQMGEAIHVTAVGYMAGHTENPSYKAVCSGSTGHAETVLVVFDPRKISYIALLKAFFEEHDPTQKNRQGNDVGTQYRSGLYVTTPAQRAQAHDARALYDEALRTRGHGAVVTEILDAGAFYFAEDYHQQYLAKNPGGYCGLEGTGVSCPIGLS